MLNRRVLVSAVALAAAALTATGCSSAKGDGANANKEAGPSVIAPGAPGERAETLSPDEAAAKAGDNAPNSADFTYARMMIEHHGQALTMTELAPKRAESASVKRLAERIEAAQAPEIRAMRGWLKDHEKKKGDGAKGEDGKKGGDGHGGGHDGGHGGGHDHDPGSGSGSGSGSGHDAASPMPGMATEAQLKSLRAAEGSAFDELFLKLMITHHQGAVTMATEALSDGKDVRVEEMANDVIAQQTSEIERMRKLP